jgi:hypothetical protein
MFGKEKEELNEREIIDRHHTSQDTRLVAHWRRVSGDSNSMTSEQRSDGVERLKRKNEQFGIPGK